jgi:hypothetical protein
MVSEAAITSLHRRLRFADDWRHRLDAALTTFGCRRNHLLSDLPNLAGNLAFDLLELVRTSGRMRYPGRVHLAALAAPLRIDQGPRYRGYWYDATSHSLVGTQLGLDLHRLAGTYHLIESNTTAAMRPERRQLYEGDVDPLISELVAAAKAWEFERIVLLRHHWTRLQTEEFKLATSRTGVEVAGATVASMHTTGEAMPNPMISLPEGLEPRTIYVVCTKTNHYSPLFYFMGSKAAVGNWLAETMKDCSDPVSRLACIPMFDQLVLPSGAPGARWPNLVVKLADSDMAKFVAMGRFTSEAEARRDLQLDDDPNAIPGVFRTALWQKALNSLFPGTLRVIYQPYVPPEVVANRARLIRLHVFVSPLVNAFLSAHGVVAGEDLPEQLPPGLVKNHGAYVVNFSRGGRYCRLAPEVEDELREVAQEFGRLANLAISKKFFVSSAEASAAARKMT